VLGLEIHAEDLLPGLVGYLSDKRMLLVLDICEHVITPVVKVDGGGSEGSAGRRHARDQPRAAGVAGEHQYRLGPLSGPPPPSELSAAALQRLSSASARPSRTSR
jgi:predicted ATPase